MTSIPDGRMSLSHITRDVTAPTTPEGHQMDHIDSVDLNGMQRSTERVCVLNVSLIGASLRLDDG